MTTPLAANLEEILAAARCLPRKAQAALVETLLHDVAAEPAGQAALETLRGMTQTDLSALAGAVVAPERQRRMKALLRKNTRGELGEAERQELDALLDEADRIALLKAKAAYTLAQRGGPSTASP